MSFVVAKVISHDTLYTATYGIGFRVNTFRISAFYIRTYASVYFADSLNALESECVQSIDIFTICVCTIVFTYMYTCNMYVFIAYFHLVCTEFFHIHVGTFASVRSSPKMACLFSGPSETFHLPFAVADFKSTPLIRCRKFLRVVV